MHADNTSPPTGNLPDPSVALSRSIEAHRNLATLRLLAGPLKGGGNDRLIADLLGTLGIRTSSRDMTKAFVTLERLGALDVDIRSGLRVVTLRRRGAELADGLEWDDEVARVTDDCPY